MTTVTGKLLGYVTGQRADMKATLVDVTGKPAVGYVASVPGELIRPVTVTPDDQGGWSVELIPNTQIVSDAGDTLWAVQEGRGLDGTPIVSYVAVPDTGSWWVGDIRADLSGTQTGQGTVVYLAGQKGDPGADGLSAFQVAQANGYTGTEAEWLASLTGPVGATGAQGQPGADGAPGAPGQDGAPGVDGRSAYEVAQQDGFTGTESEWLASLVGPQGIQGVQGPQGDTGPAGPQPPLGAAGAGDTIALKSTDPSTTNARTPTAHASTHGSAGSDPVTVAQSQVTGLSSSLAGLLPLAGGTMTGTTNATLASSTALWLAALASGDSFDRIRLYLDRLELGPGTATRDTFLRRLGANALGTDGAFTVGGAFKQTGLMTWRQRHLPDHVVADSLYAGTAPTISTTQTTTPTTGYIKYAPSGVALAGTDVTGPFTYAGAGNFQIGSVSPDTNYVLPLSKYPNTYASGQGVWSLEFGTDAQIIQVRFKYISSASMYRLSVDGRKVTDLMQSSGGTTAGSGHMLTVDFGSAAPRRIRFDFATMPFGGVYIPPTATLWGVPLQGGRLMVLGDSISDGSAQNTGAGAGTWFARAARFLGATDAWEQGRGGTGYITPGSYATFGDRVQGDVINWAPDRLIVWGGYNDNSGSQSSIQTAANSLYASIKSGLPNCQVYVIGCWSPTGSPATSIQNTDNTLKAAAAAAGFPFISPLTGGCYDSAGNLVTTQGAWITSANAAGYIGADSVHPTDAGHVYLSRRITQAVRALMPA